MQFPSDVHVFLSIHAQDFFLTSRDDRTILPPFVKNCEKLVITLAG